MSEFNEADATSTLEQPSESGSDASSSSLDRAPILITNYKLTGNNYLSWSRVVEMFITGRGKEDYLFGILSFLHLQIPRVELGNQKIL